MKLFVLATLIAIIAANCQPGIHYAVYKDANCRVLDKSEKQIVIGEGSIKRHYNQCNNHPTKSKSYAFKCNSIGIEHEFYA